MKNRSYCFNFISLLSTFSIFLTFAMSYKPINMNEIKQLFKNITDTNLAFSLYLQPVKTNKIKQLLNDIETKTTFLYCEKGIQLGNLSSYHMPHFIETLTQLNTNPKHEKIKNDKWLILLNKFTNIHTIAYELKSHSLKNKSFLYKNPIDEYNILCNSFKKLRETDWNTLAVLLKEKRKEFSNLDTQIVFDQMITTFAAYNRTFVGEKYKQLTASSIENPISIENSISEKKAIKILDTINSFNEYSVIGDRCSLHVPQIIDILTQWQDTRTFPRGETILIDKNYTDRNLLLLLNRFNDIHIAAHGINHTMTIKYDHNFTKPTEVYNNLLKAYTTLKKTDWSPLVALLEKESNSLPPDSKRTYKEMMSTLSLYNTTFYNSKSRFHPRLKQHGCFYQAPRQKNIIE